MAGFRQGYGTQQVNRNARGLRGAAGRSIAGAGGGPGRMGQDMDKRKKGKQAQEGVHGVGRSFWKVTDSFASEGFRFGSRGSGHGHVAQERVDRGAGGRTRFTQRAAAREGAERRRLCRRGKAVRRVLPVGGRIGRKVRPVALQDTAFDRIGRGRRQGQGGRIPGPALRLGREAELGGEAGEDLAAIGGGGVEHRGLDGGTSRKLS